MRARHEITRKFAKQYAEAAKNEKSRLLDEVCAITDRSRDNARRQLKAALKPRRLRPRKRKPRPVEYSHDALKVAITLLTEGKRLDVYGTAAGPLVVYGTREAGNDFAWRRLSIPGVSDPDSEITVPVGNLNGVYRKQSTVDAKLAKQAGEFFIRNGELDSSLTWEEGQDVLDRLPPTRFRV